MVPGTNEDAFDVDANDPDAPWRPRSRVPVAGVDLLPGGHDPEGREQVVAVAARSVPDAGHEATSAWSRAAIEQSRDWRAEFRRESARRSADPHIPFTRPLLGRPVAHVDGLPASAVTGQLVLTAVGLLGVLVVAALVGVALVTGAAGDGRAVSRAASLELPTEAAELWSDVGAARVEQVAAGAGVVLVRRATGLVAHDGRSGEVLWTRPAAAGVLGSELAIIDGTVLVTDRQLGGRPSTTALDVHTGDERWSRVNSTDRLSVFGRWLYALAPTPAGVDLQVIDPHSGEPRDPSVETAIDRIATNVPYLPEVVGGRLALYDIDRARRVTPPVDVFGTRALDLVGGRLVALDDDATIAVFDAAGDRVDERRFTSDAAGEFPGRVQLVGSVPGGDIGVVASGSSIGFRVVDDRIEVVWELAGQVGAPVPTDIGPVSVGRLVDPGSGEVDWALIDPLTGSVFTVVDVGRTLEADPVAARNGYLVAPAVGAAPREVAAVGYDGTPMWTVELPESASYQVAGGFLLVVERAGAESRVTVFG